MVSVGYILTFYGCASCEKEDNNVFGYEGAFFEVGSACLRLLAANGMDALLVTIILTCMYTAKKLQSMILRSNAGVKR